MQSLTIHLDDKDYTIRELTVGQVEDIQELVGAFTSQGAPTISKETNRAIIAVALSADYPDVTAESVRKMRLGTIKKMADVVREILRFGGFIEDAPQGEASAGAE